MIIPNWPHITDSSQSFVILLLEMKKVVENLVGYMQEIPVTIVLDKF